MFDEQIETELEVPSTFHVTERNLEYGIKNDKFRCALAISMCESGCDWASVSHSQKSAIFSYQNRMYKMHLDEKTLKKIKDFDSGKKLSPFVVTGEPI